MKCNSCGFENSLGSTVCAKCGTPLTNTQNNFQSPNNNLTDNNEEKVEKLNNLFNSVETNNTFNNSNNNLKTKKKNNKNIIFLVLAIIVLALIIYFGMMFFSPSPKKIFSNFTNNLYSSLKATTDSEYNSIYFDMSYSLNVSGIESEELGSIINKFSIKLNGGIDYKNKTFIYNLKTDYNNKELISVDAQYNKNFYITLNNLYDKPIMVEENDFSDMFEKTDNKDLNVVVKGFVDALNNSLDESYFTSSDSEIEQDGKKIKTKVTSLKINKDNYEKISKKMMDELKNNNEFIEAYAKMNDIDKEEVKEALNSDNLDSSSFGDLSEDMTINLYTTGITNKFVKVEVVSNGSTYCVESKKDNLYVITVSNEEVSISLQLKYNQEFDKEIKLKDVSGAINEDEVGEDFTNALGNIVNSEGYIELNKDVEASFGYIIEDLFASLFGLGNYPDTSYNYDYSLDTNYDYNYNYEDYSTYETFNY